MKLGIFSEYPNAYGPRRFREESRKLGISGQIISYELINFRISEGKVEVEYKDKKLPSFDLIIFRSFKSEFNPQRDYLRFFFEKKGARILNNASLRRWPRLDKDKFTQHLIFQKAGLPFVETRVFGRKEDLINKIGTLPKVVKAFYGSHGDNVFKIEKKGDLTRVLQDFPAYSLFVQPFLTAGEDLRVIVVGGRAIGAMKRIAQPGKFLTNYSAGGKVEKYQLDKETARLAEAAAKVFYLDYVGVDLMKDEKGNWRILEVNRACQFEGFEKATGINVAKKVIKFLLNKNKK